MVMIGHARCHARCCARRFARRRAGRAPAVSPAVRRLHGRVAGTGSARRRGRRGPGGSAGERTERRGFTDLAPLRSRCPASASSGQQSLPRRRKSRTWTRPQPAGIRASDAIASCLLATRGLRTPPTMLKADLEHSWRWRESNPRPSVHHQGFSGRSLLCFSQPRRSRKLDADRLSRCWMSRLAPRPRQAVILLADASYRVEGIPGLTDL
jgi:hypothetical protein